MIFIAKQIIELASRGEGGPLRGQGDSGDNGKGQSHDRDLDNRHLIESKSAKWPWLKLLTGNLDEQLAECVRMRGYLPIV